MNVIKGALKSGVSKFRSFQPKKTEGLDLSYIPYGQGQQRIIAMCLPSGGGGMDFLLRNDATEVGAYLDSRHKGCYKVYNLTEHAHPDHVREIFHGATVHIPIPDHNVPRFDQIVSFCEDAFEFLESSPNNIVAVHCKAGKGRTGVMIVSLLLYSGACKTIQEALDTFSKARSELTVVKMDEKGGKDEIARGVDQASQLRWLEYWQRFMYEILRDDITNQAQLDKLRSSVKLLRSVTVFDMGTANVDRSSYPPPYIIVREWGYKGNGGLQICRRACTKEKPIPNGRKLYYDFPDSVCVGEVKLEFWDIGVIKDSVSYRCWVHPYFIGHTNRLVLKKSQIDDVWNSSKYGSSFRIELLFADTTEGGRRPRAELEEPVGETRQEPAETSLAGDKGILIATPRNDTAPDAMEMFEEEEDGEPASQTGDKQPEIGGKPLMAIDETYFIVSSPDGSVTRAHKSSDARRSVGQRVNYLSEKELLKALQKAIHSKDANTILKLADQNRSNSNLSPSVLAILDSTLRSTANPSSSSSSSSSSSLSSSSSMPVTTSS